MKGVISRRFQFFDFVNYPEAKIWHPLVSNRSSPASTPRNDSMDKKFIKEKIANNGIPESQLSKLLLRCTKDVNFSFEGKR